jgi:hypothetical protein
VSVLGGIVFVDGGGLVVEDVSVRVTVFSVVVECAGWGWGRVNGGVGAGMVAAIVPGWAVDVVVAVTSVSVKFEVVSALVPVIDAGGGTASPGALIVDVTPLACPSCTTSYCCRSLRCKLPELPPWHAASRAAVAR